MAGIRERSNIEVFFTALGDDKVSAAFLRIALASRALKSGVAGSFNLAASGINDIGAGLGRATSLMRRAGGVLRSGFDLAYGSIKSVVGALADAGKTGLRFGAIMTAVSAGGLFAIGKAIGSITEAGQDLQSTVLGLRALNGVVEQNSKLPSFGYAKGGEGATGDKRRVVTGASKGLSSAYDQVVTEAGAAGAKAGDFIDTNSVGKNAADLSFLSRAADKYGLSIQSVGKQYLQFSAAAKSANLSVEEQQRVLTGVADASVVLGISADDTNGILRALNQVASKGTLQAEELRGQIGDRLPGAFGLAARAMGVTEETLNSLMKNGLVKAPEFLRAFSSQLTKEYGPDAQKVLGTTRVATGRLANAYVQAKAVIFSNKQQGGSVFAGAIVPVRSLDESVGNLLTTVSMLIKRLGQRGVFGAFGSSLGGIVDRISGVVATSDNLVTGFLEGVIRFGNGAVSFLKLIGRGFQTLSFILFSPVYSENSVVIRFFQSIIATIRGLYKVMTSAPRPKIVGALSTGLDRVVKVIDQIARSLYNVSQGGGAVQLFPGLDGRFQVITSAVAGLVNIINNTDGATTTLVNNLIAGFDKASGTSFQSLVSNFEQLKNLLSGGAAPGDGQFASLYELRDAVINIAKHIEKVIPKVIEFGKGVYEWAKYFKPALDGLAQMVGFDDALEAGLFLTALKLTGVLPLLAGSFGLLVAPLKLIGGLAGAVFKLGGFDTALAASVESSATKLKGKGAKGFTLAFKTIADVGVKTVKSGFSAMWKFIIAEATTTMAAVQGIIAFFLSPAGLVVLAVAAMIAIGYVVYKYWDEIVAFLRTSMTAIGDFLSGVFEGAWEGIKTAGQAVWEFLKAGFLTNLNTILLPIRGLFELVKKLAQFAGIKIFDDVEFPVIGGEKYDPVEIAKNAAAAASNFISGPAKPANTGGALATAAGANSAVSDKTPVVFDINGTKVPAEMRNPDIVDVRAAVDKIAQKQAGETPAWAAANNR